MKIYTLTNDYLFKKVFSNKKFLKHLLFNFFDIKVDNIEYLNTYLIKSNRDGKVGIVDLLLNVDDEIVILELQNIDRHNFKERLLFYSSSVIANHCLKIGDNYNNLRGIKVYTIINYELFKYNIKNKVRLKVQNKIFTKKLEYKIFDLTKAYKSEKKTRYSELVNLFKINDLEKLEKIIKSQLNLEILEEIKNYNRNSEEYKKMEDIEMLMMNETEHYEDAYIDGFNIGNSQGIKQGISKGKNERNIEIAKKMIENNVEIAFISEITGLTKEQIVSL